MRAARVLGVLFAVLFLAGTARAAPAPEDVVPPEAEGQEPPPAPAATRVTCLEDLSPTGDARKGVQKRDFLKKYKLEVSALGGLFASDALSSTYTAGAALAFFPAEDLGIEVLGSYTPAQFRLEEPFVEFGEPRRFTPGRALSILGALTFSPIHAKFKLTEATILHGDLHLLVGAGRTLHDSVQGLTFQAGLGLRLYLLSRLGFRFELRDVILPQEVLGVGRATHNLTVMGGFGFWFG